MSAPYNPVLDTFNRSNGGVGVNWAALANGFNVSSNQCVGTSGASFNFGYWSAASFNADQEAYCYFPVKPANGEACAVYCRMKDLAIGTVDGYLFGCTAAAGTDTLAIQIITNAAATTLVSVSQEMNNGDGLRLVAFGSLLTGYRYDVSSGRWSWACSVIDTTYAAGGNIGLLLQNNTVRADDFGGGNVVYTPKRRVWQLNRSVLELGRRGVEVY